jgi:hypothetical protein
MRFFPIAAVFAGVASLSLAQTAASDASAPPESRVSSGRIHLFTKDPRSRSAFGWT